MATISKLYWNILSISSYLFICMLLNMAWFFSIANNRSYFQKWQSCSFLYDEITCLSLQFQFKLGLLKHNILAWDLNPSSYFLKSVFFSPFLMSHLFQRTKKSQILKWSQKNMDSSSAYWYMMHMIIVFPASVTDTQIWAVHIVTQTKTIKVTHI